jgi:hypothetical protein
MKLSTAVETLVTGEQADHFTLTREPYGWSLALVAVGRRLIVDLIPRQLKRQRSL